MPVISLVDRQLNLSDITDCLRTLADDIEQGRLPADAAVVLLHSEGEHPEVLGFGAVANHLQIMGLIARAMVTLGNCEAPGR